MKNIFIVLILIFITSNAKASRIKDIVSIEGIRNNMLIGYGLVVGLNGTGDRLKNSAFTEQSLIAFLERQGVNTRGIQLKTRNVAAVTITANLPAFARTGGHIDVSVAALGDAKSLLGGTLLATPLYAADGQVYAVSQGTVAIGGFSAKGDSGSSITKGVPTSGVISNGAIIEREVKFSLNKMQSVKLAMRNPDLSTASNIANVINNRIGFGTATMDDPGTVSIKIPPSYKGDVANLLADIEKLNVETDQRAKIVIDEGSGTIVMGDNVRIDKIAVAQGNLIVKIDEKPMVSQPDAFAPEGAKTVVVPRTKITIDENSDAKMTIMHSGATLRELVSGLNALGVGPRDLIAILQTIKAAGALQADIEIR